MKMDHVLFLNHCRQRMQDSYTNLPFVHPFVAGTTRSPDNRIRTLDPENQPKWYLIEEREFALSFEIGSVGLTRLF